MKRYAERVCVAAVILHGFAVGLYAHAGPSDGTHFKGRIAFSSDGNYNDEDDWGAFPVAIAVLDAFGVTDKLVHGDYCNILPKNDARFYREMVESVTGAAQRYGVSPSVLFDCQKDLNGAVESIRNAINASSADNPLYYVLAGPMEVPFRGIEASDPHKRKYVYCISHNSWNDGYTRSDQDLHMHNKRDVIPSGINWIQCRDGNRHLAHPGGVGKRSTPEQWGLYQWLRDARDPRLRWIFTRLKAEGRADISDATMTYFLLTGDEDADLTKLKSLLDDGKRPDIIIQRQTIRMEAENFRSFDGCTVAQGDRRASKRLYVRLSGRAPGSITGRFDEIYAAGGHYDIAVRYAGAKDDRCRFRLHVNGVPKSDPWQASRNSREWVTHTIEDVAVGDGDEIMVVAQGRTGKLDYVEFHYRGPASHSSKLEDVVELDDPAALPGQLIVAGAHPGYLKYNGGGPAFLCGPDNPEDFLFRGTLNPDGTRSDGEQEEMIERLARAGVNAFHCQMTRMRRCNYKGEGDDTHTPFIDHDPSRGLNEAVLDQWDGWLDQFERHGIVVHLEFYNDATDVEMMSWALDADGNLHADERRWIAGIVRRFKHHKNILWGIEESCNKLPAARTAHFKKIGELIAQTDNHNHPIVQSFVVPNDPEGDFPDDGITSDAYTGDSHIRVVTWLHVVPHGEDLEAQHQEYLTYRNRDAARFVVMKNETYHHPRRGALSRRYMWSCAMTGMHCLEAYHHADGRRTDDSTLRDDGRISTFMEMTDFHKMQPRDDLASGSTQWVLANPAHSYIAYTYQYAGSMGIRDAKAGIYDLLWFDTVDGDTVEQAGLAAGAGDVTWPKPETIGNEVALYIKRRS